MMHGSVKQNDSDEREREGGGGRKRKMQAHYTRYTGVSVSSWLVGRHSEGDEARDYVQNERILRKDGEDRDSFN